MSKIGRPSLDEAKRKQVVVTLRLDKAEHAEMLKAASDKGVKFSAWARENLLDVARSSR